MAAKQKGDSREWLVNNPEIVGDALANVIAQDGGREIILGQAWLVATGRLVTCGHVVERYASSPYGLFVKFPSSGNKYPVSLVRLHPSFVRQPDQLVKFDVALLEVNLGPPESQAYPLPFTYERPMRTNQTLWAIRYPAHLGQYSAAIQPLTQEGKYLGLLRKHDAFHVLHDLPLSPGDSGAPISDGSTIVGIHCGDTATLPGLNLPTTSIRLALWVDALRDLGLAETMHQAPVRGGKWLIPAAVALLVCALASGAIAYQYFQGEVKNKWSIDEPSLAPVNVSFNEPIHKYPPEHHIEIRIVPHTDCYLYLAQIDDAGTVFVLYPQRNQEAYLDKGEMRIINSIGLQPLRASPSKDKLVLLVINANDERESKALAHDALGKDDWSDGPTLTLGGKAILERWGGLKRLHPELVMLQTFDAPHSN